MYEAPPTGPPQHPGGAMEEASHDMMMAHYQAGKAAVQDAPGLAEAEAGPVGSSAQAGRSSPAVQQPTPPDEAVPQKGWCVSKNCYGCCIDAMLWQAQCWLLAL